MALRQKVLRKKAEKFELKMSLKYKVIPERTSVLEEILRDVYDIHRPKPSDYDSRRDLICVFNEIAKEIYGDSNDSPVVEDFGSFSMDLFSTKSDLDLSVNFRNSEVELPREKKIQTLRKFAKKFYALQRQGHVSGVHPITNARVPIVKVIDRGTGVECDISVDNKDGILKSKIISMMSLIDERFPKLSFLMKIWGKAHNINSSKDRTLNSLSIILLVAFHLQTRSPPILPAFSAILKDGTDPAKVVKLVRNFSNYGRGNTESLAVLFITLLMKLSSVEILWAKGLCASTYEGSWISKTWDSKVGCISVEDFTDRSQNVARAVGTGEIKGIYKCIQSSLQNVVSFVDGQIQAHKLRELLFGQHSLPTPVGTHIIKPDNIEAQSCIPPESIPAKRMRTIDGWGGTPQAASSKPFSKKGVQSPEDRGGIHTQNWRETPREGWGGAEFVGSWGRRAAEGWGGGGTPINGWEHPQNPSACESIGRGSTQAKPKNSWEHPQNPIAYESIPRGRSTQARLEIPSIHGFARQLEIPSVFGFAQPPEISSVHGNVQLSHGTSSSIPQPTSPCAPGEFPSVFGFARRREIPSVFGLAQPLENPSNHGDIQLSRGTSSSSVPQCSSDHPRRARGFGMSCRKNQVVGKWRKHRH